MYTFEEKYRRLQKELFAGMAVLVGLFLLGTIWYRFVDGWSWLDAAYMTTITLATVGFGEIQPLDETSRLFTMILIFMGLITIGYIVNRFTEAIVQGYFQQGIRLRQEKRLLEKLANHYIVCGFGRTGRQVAVEFQSEGIAFIVIDSRPEQVAEAKQRGYVALLGDATLDDSLLSAKIDKAIGLIAALSSDAENLYTVLSAKTLNPKVRTIARASTEEAVQKLQRAGADAVVSPYITGGRRLAAAALRPQVMDFVDGIISGADRAFYMEEFVLEADNCPYLGQTLSQAKLRFRTGALVLAIRRTDGILIAGPTGETILMPGDLIIAMGTAEQLRELNRLLVPINSSFIRLPKQPN